MSVPISIHSLKEGWKVGEAILAKDGKRVLIQKGCTLTPNFIQRLKEELLTNGRRDFFINIEVNPNLKTEEDLEIESISREQKEYRESILMQDFDMKDDIDIGLKTISKDNLKKAYVESDKNLEVIINTIQKSMSAISAQMANNSNFSYSLGQYKESLNDGSEHSLRVAQFSIALASVYNKNIVSGKEINLDSIATAALLHDYGTSFEKNEKKLQNYDLNPNLVSKYNIPNNLLSGYNPKYSTVYAYTVLSKILPAAIANAILLSGATENSVFFTAQEQQDAPFVIAARIIAICNMYDTLLTKVINEEKGMEEVSSTMLQLAALGYLNKDLTELLINNIPLYSVGVRVLLSNGLYAIVKESFTGKENTAKPIVKILGASSEYQGIIPEIIDLRYTTTITIKSIVGSSEMLSNKIVPTSKDKQTEFISSLMEDQIRTMGIESFHGREVLPKAK